MFIIIAIVISGRCWLLVITGINICEKFIRGLSDMYLWILLYFAMINLIGYIIMWRDKKAAKRNSWRTSEKMIFQIALIGGAAGIYVGMRHFRHKTQKIR